ncbi:hypothetical protein SDC9_192174 [bioreactor metagenome]|uniref:Uncharacterized protein n=1 Tax=bioreactor metagenome TaxID=1076179 RepID=A0A645I2G5_9ZZZZ
MEFVLLVACGLKLLLKVLENAKLGNVIESLVKFGQSHLFLKSLENHPVALLRT